MAHTKVITLTLEVPDGDFATLMEKISARNVTMNENDFQSVCWYVENVIQQEYILLPIENEHFLEIRVDPGVLDPYTGRMVGGRIYCLDAYLSWTPGWRGDDPDAHSDSLAIQLLSLVRKYIMEQPRNMVLYTLSQFGI